MEKMDLKKSLAADWSASVRRLRLIFWPIFATAEILFLAVQIVYIATHGISVIRFVVNLVIFNIILIGLLLTCYFLIKRLLLRIYYLESELLRANAELKGYAQIVSHDLKAPLAAISLAAQTLPILLEAPPTEETVRQVEELTETITQCVERSSSLIRDLLTLAEAGQLPEEVSDVDVRALVGEILDEMAGEIGERGTVVKVDDDLGHVRANPTHIYQLFANLIRNAVRHNDSSEPLVEVINKGRDGNAQRFLIRDNGSGIPETDMASIFVPFFKGRQGDTGIGLSTVDKIVGVYSGEIKVFNDNGACFEFVIRDFNHGVQR